MSRPLPHPTAETKLFWDGCRDGELRYQSCAACGSVQLIPRSLCANCQHDNLDWRVSSGLGRVLSFTQVYRAPIPAFRDSAPYFIALVDMDEGFRLMVNVENDTCRGLAVGQRLRIGF